MLLAERLAPAPALLPADPASRALALGLAHELCGEAGLGWSRRLAQDYEVRPDNAETMVKIAMMHLHAKRLA